MKIDLPQALNIAKDACQKASRLVVSLKDSNQITESYKKPLDMVTSADHASDKLISDVIRAAYPDHRIFSEESSPQFSNLEGPVWVLDPIDGTVNFAHGFPQVGISLALAVDGEVVLGVVQSVFRDEVFHAIKGGGAFLNDKQIQCRQRNELKEALVATGFPYSRSNLGPLMKRVEAVLSNCHDLRRTGAASLDACWVACGRQDAYYESVEPWDIAAGGLIAREAGAMTGNLSEPKRRPDFPKDLNGEDFLVANSVLFEKLAEILKI